MKPLECAALRSETEPNRQQRTSLSSSSFDFRLTSPTHTPTLPGLRMAVLSLAKTFSRPVPRARLGNKLKGTPVLRLPLTAGAACSFASVASLLTLVWALQLPSAPCRSGQTCLHLSVPGVPSAPTSSWNNAEITAQQRVSLRAIRWWHKQEMPGELVFPFLW